MKSAYVSSTFRDLEEARAHVSEALRRLGFLDVAMEHYGADERRPVQRCVEDVAECDLYVGVVAFRRGYIPEDANPLGLSITELEYEAAKANGIDTLVFLLHEDAAWPRSLMDTDMSDVEAFRGRLSTETSADRFDSAADLTAKVTQAVSDWQRRAEAVPAATTVEPINLDAYRSALRSRYEALDLDVLTPPEVGDQPAVKLQSVFVEPTLQPGMQNVPMPAAVRRRLASDDSPPRDARPPRLLRATSKDGPALTVFASSDNRQVVLGQPGAGKSTLVRHVALGLATGDPTVVETLGAAVPFVVELRQYAPHYRSGAVDSPLAFLQRLSKAEGWGIEDGTLGTIVNEGSLVLFDGLDEVFDPALRTEVARQIAAFADRHPTARVVVTSRIVGYQPRLLDAAGFAHSSIASLDRGQIDTFLSRWYAEAGVPPDKAEALRVRLLEAYDDLPSIRQLAGSPLLLTLLALINRHRELPRERVRLYEHAAQVLVHHWDVSKEIAHHPTGQDLDEQDKTAILRRLALDMQSGVDGLAGNYLHGDDLIASFVRYLQDRYSLDALRAQELAQRLIERFRVRNYVLVLYGAELFGFVHRALLEYFAALAIQTQFEKSREIDEQELEAIVLERAEDPAWREVLLLLLSLLGAPVTARLVEALLKDPLPLSLYEVPRPLGLALAALGDARERGVHAPNAKRALSLVGTRLEQALTDPPWHWSLMTRRSDPLLQSVTDVARRWPHPDLAIDWLGRNATAAWPEPQTLRLGESIDSLHATVGIYLNRLAGGLRAVAEGDESHTIQVVALGLMLRLYIGLDNPSHRAVGLWGWAFHPLSMNPTGDPERAGAPPVVDRLHHDEVEAVRWHAVGALLTIAVRTETSHAEAFQRVAQSDPSPEVRAAALFAFVASEVRALETGDPMLEQIEFAERFLQDDSPTVRIAAINSLASLPFDPPRLESQAHRLLRSDPDNLVRWRITALLGDQLGDRPDTYEVVTSVALADKHKQVREEAVRVLVDSFSDHETYAIHILRALKGDRAPSVRLRALRAAVEAPTPFEPLDDTLFEASRADRSPEVRSAARRALYGRREEADEDLLLLLYHTLEEDSNGDNRLEAASELVRRDPNSARVTEALRSRKEHDRSKRVRAELSHTLDPARSDS